MAKRGSRIELEFPPATWRFSTWQQRVWEDCAELDGPREIHMVCGRGSGKDILAIRCVLRDVFKLWGRRQNDDSGLVRNPLVKVFVVAPQENNLKQVWDDWAGELAALARAWRISYSDTDDPDEHGWFFRHVVRERKFVIFGRGEIEIEARLSSTPDALRGPGVDIVHWTEAAIETRQGEFERGRDGELAGTLVRAGRHGRAYYTTTPKGPFGGYYKRVIALFGEAAPKVENGSMRSEDRRAVYYNFDSYANEFLTPEQLKDIAAEVKLGWYFEQERLARYVIGDKGGAKVFARALVYGCVVEEPLPVASGPDGRNGRADDPLAHRRPAARGAKLRRIGFGVDIARYGDDFTVYCGVDQDTGEIVRLERKEHLSGRAIVTDIERLAKAYPGATFRVDSTGHKGYIAD